MITCERCKTRDAEPANCPGDGSSHHHGRVHVAGGGLQAVCPACLIDVTAE